MSSSLRAFLRLLLNLKFLLLFPLFSEPLAILLTLLLVVFFPAARVVLVAYWTVCFLDPVPYQGGSDFLSRIGLIQKIRGGSWWKEALRFGSISIEKTVDLPSDKVYLFGYHPHGVIPAGIANLCTDGSNVSKLFPGIRIQVVTLKLMWFIPFWREWMYLHDVTVASRGSIHSSLSRGRSVCVIVGGAEEALETKSGRMRLVLRKRKQFFICAVKAGASLVPTMTFGENEVYNTLSNPPGSPLRRVQDFFMSAFTFSVPLFYGPVMALPLLPKMVPITTVVGSPIQTTRSDSPSPEYIDQLQEEYIKGLEKLTEEHKARLGYENLKLEIVA
ncbi:hypothetical protein NDN08_006555 [Rhodosorus marinus]|uniref:Acyltransferase n=1 Tax=Rhodosorus marinus TaxID=101924 RepID=A0AAV8ULK1_9RHOD|nr:hypothetical protein NDN08_006555 [Rhodosorus marinus]